MIVFEMVTGKIPFGKNAENTSEMDIYAGITSFKRGQKLSYPKEVPSALIDFVTQLLVPEPSGRLGVGADGIQKCKDHEWFEGFDWEALQSKTMKSPLADIATSYFNECMKAAVMS